MQLYYSKLLQNHANITHAFTTRDGGVSQAPYDSLNLAFHVHDDAKSVEHNHELLACELGFKKKNLVYMNQIHSNIVVLNPKPDFSKPQTCDALVTNQVNVPLMVMVADCSPILFYDPIEKVVAVAHAGRAGAFSNIVKNTIEAMNENFGSHAKNIVVSIGASISQESYEVGEEIYTEEFDYAFRKKEEKYYLDVNAILEKQLLACGIKKEHLEIINECTCQNSDTYFSYRADGVTGRCAGVILLKD